MRSAPLYSRSGHPGIDLRAVGRAARANLQSAERREGGSTISQQLARTLFLENRRSWSRKIREASIALLLEARYSKARILEAYLNSIYLGHDGNVPVHGLGAASQRFFGKDLGALEIHEAAWLAGAIRAPNLLLDGKSAEARRRRDTILTALRDEGRIEPAAAERAMGQPLRRRPPTVNSAAPYFVDVVAHELIRRATLPASGSVNVQTTLGVEVRGGEVAGQRPYLHLPEAWLRAYEENSVLDWVAWGLSLGILGAALFLVVALFVGAVRARRFPWRSGLRWGALAAGLVLALAALRWQSDLVPRYQTEFPWQLFLVGIAISVFLLVVVIGLAVTVLAGTILAVRPRLGALFAGGCDPGYVRDGILLGILGIVLLVGVRRSTTVLTSVFSQHAHIGELPVFEAAARTLPWLDVYLTQVLSVLVLLPVLALLVHIVSGRLGWRLGIPALGVAALVLGLDGARSVPQFGLQFATAAVGLGLVVYVVAYLFRGNELAYLVAFAGARGLGAAAPWFEHQVPGARLAGTLIALLVVATLLLIVARASGPRPGTAAEIPI